MAIALGAVCLAMAVFSLIYVVWTHVLFTKTHASDLARIAVSQFRRGPSRLSRIAGFGSAGNWAISAASAALVVAVAASIVGVRGGGWWLPIVVLLTAGASWATMVYAFALRYYRLDAAGERFAFEIAEDPAFIDFVSMAVMVSSVGALSAGSPRSRAGLTAVRTHTFVAFGFNALVVAMTVSLVTTLISAAS